MINRLAEGKLKEKGYDLRDVDESAGNRSTNVAYG